MKSGKRGQVTIFIIVAILIIVGIAVYFFLRNGIGNEIPKNMQPVYDYYMSCLNQNAEQGISIMGSQGGWLYAPDFVPGSQYMPFSSQLDFFGEPVPYWLYVSGNNIMKEQVPTKTQMQDQLARFISERADTCDFGSFEMQGYDVAIDDNPDVSVSISDTTVSASIKDPIHISFDGDTATVSSHNLNINSKMGKLYNLAVKTYNYEKSQMFLENYAVDAMRMYAPVTGVELTCAPKVFNEQKIKNDLVNALSSNVGMLKLKGNYYSLQSQEMNYFVTDIGQSVDEQTNFIYSPQWPTKIEMYGDTAVQPVGMQEGLGILGFCYVPYQFVYDIDFPVLVQFISGREIFQFPVAVIIDKNQPRKAIQGDAGLSIESDVCQYPDYPVNIRTYDSQLNPVEANLKFKCLNSQCSIGESKMQNGEAIFSGKVPACVNGFIVANAEGYAESKYQISTNEESSANVILNKLYNVTLDLGKVDQALIYFKSEDYSTTVLYPDTRNVQLIDGDYNISVYAYTNSTLKLAAVSQQKCIQVPKSGIGGAFGMTEEKCVDISLPEQDVTMAIVGGGRTEDYLTEGQLSSAQKLNINVPLFKTPTNINEVQDNYLALDNSIIYVDVIQ